MRMRPPQTSHQTMEWTGGNLGIPKTPLHRTLGCRSHKSRPNLWVTTNDFAPNRKKLHNGMIAGAEFRTGNGRRLLVPAAKRTRTHGIHSNNGTVQFKPSSCQPTGARATQTEPTSTPPKKQQKTQTPRKKLSRDFQASSYRPTTFQIESA